MADRPRQPGLTAKQRELSRTVLGGTDAAAVFGLSRYRTAWDVWEEKRGVIRPRGEMSEDALWGLLLEPVILAEYARREGIALRKPARLVRHPQRRWQAGHLDGRARDRLVEVKVRGSDRDWGQPGSDEVPPDVKMQALHYAAVTRLPRVDVAVLFRGQRLAVYSIVPPRAVLDDLSAEEEEWWQRHVVQGEEPEYDGDPRSTAVIRRTYPRSTDRTLVALPHQYGLLDDLVTAHRKVRTWGQQEERLQQAIMSAMEDARAVVAPGVKIYWSSYEKQQTAWKEYATDLEGLVLHLVQGTLPIKMDPLEVMENIKSLHTAKRQERRFSVHEVKKPRLEEGVG